jgi:hypothetical protein
MPHMQTHILFNTHAHMLLFAACADKEEDAKGPNSAVCGLLTSEALGRVSGLEGGALPRSLEASQPIAATGELAHRLD